MIGSLRGTLADRDTNGEVTLEVAGVGYRVTVTPAGSVEAGEVGDEVFLWIHHHIREDAQVLYGFLTKDERTVFAALLGAHGVGPALALNILAVHDPAALQRAVLDDDVAALCLVPGVGKKTATRLLVELKGALDVPEIDLTVSSSTGGSVPASGGGAAADVRDALVGLGYGPDEIHEVLREVPAEGDSATMLKDALQRLASW